MSEANAPFNRPDQAESVDSSGADQQDSFINPFGEMPEVDAEADSLDQSMQFSPSPGANTHGDRFPNAAQSVTVTSGTETWLNPSESTDLADLISLIQELNQCNSILLDRVSQLEEALERSQNALKAEVKRSQDHSLADYHPGLATAQDLAAAQEQAIDLYNQLEFVHQTSQRQQILIETLTGQLETSQERVAQLERESALVQQRFNEQTQLLAQQENNCRDLQARLHRQQRYTLQFKAALEKSLDVSTPHYEPVAEVLGVAHSPESSFLPKVQHIEPWTSPADISPARFPWMKLSSELLKEPTAPSATTQPVPKIEAPFNAGDIPVAKPKRSKLASVKLPGFQPIDTVSSPASANLNTESLESIDASAIPDEQLMQKLDAMVQPLADLLAEAVLTEVNSTNFEASNSEASSEAAGVMAEPVTNNVTNLSTDDSAVTNTTNADDLLNSVMADAEDALWQDLARLIDVSTEDVVKASLSGDLSAFESINFDALQGDALQGAPAGASENSSQGISRQSISRTPSHTQPADTFASISEPFTESPQSAAFFGEPEEPIANEATDSRSVNLPNPASVFGAAPSWPAPLIYPTRPAKKRRSLAAVDLPSFLQQQPGPLPT